MFSSTLISFPVRVTFKTSGLFAAEMSCGQNLAGGGAARDGQESVLKSTAAPAKAKT
jgi:hypothetical protein